MHVDRVASERADANVEQQQTRRAIRQWFSREANEHISSSHPTSCFVEYECECSQQSCDEFLSLSVDEYEEVRSVPTYFIVARGHAANEGERVVRESARYEVIEKTGGAGRLASRLDPRLRHTGTS